MSGLLLIALATLVSEDLTCIATGVLVAQGRLGFVPGVLACLLGIFFGDILLFLTGRVAGRAAFRWKAFQKFASPAKVEAASRWLSERGMAVILLSRFTPGLRLTTYFAAGMLKTKFWRFASMFLVASAIWTPLLVGSTAVFGEQGLRTVFARRGDAFVIFAALFVTAIIARKIIQLVTNYGARRRLAGFLKRKDPLGILAAVGCVSSARPVSLLSRTETPVTHAVHGGQSRHAFGRVRGRIQVADSGPSEQGE